MAGTQIKDDENAFLYGQKFYVILLSFARAQSCKAFSLVSDAFA